MQRFSRGRMHFLRGETGPFPQICPCGFCRFAFAPPAKSRRRIFRRGARGATRETRERAGWNRLELARADHRNRPGGERWLGSRARARPYGCAERSLARLFSNRRNRRKCRRSTGPSGVRACFDQENPGRPVPVIGVRLPPGSVASRTACEELPGNDFHGFCR